MSSLLKANRLSQCYLIQVSICILSLVAGCGRSSEVAPSSNARRQGSVHGGQQPVSGATVQLYAVGTNGDQSDSTPLFADPPTTNKQGAFEFAIYQCPSPDSLVYIVAQGGNPGLSAGSNNAALALMAALGPCSTLSSSTFITINEVTTVAAVFALSPFMASVSKVGSLAGEQQGLESVFTLAAELADVSTGTSPGTFAAGPSNVPIFLINSLADSLAACINSTGGKAGDASACRNALC